MIKKIITKLILPLHSMFWKVVDFSGNSNLLYNKSTVYFTTKYSCESFYKPISKIIIE